MNPCCLFSKMVDIRLLDKSFHFTRLHSYYLHRPLFYSTARVTTKSYPPEQLSGNRKRSDTEFQQKPKETGNGSSGENRRKSHNIFSNYLQTLKWTPIPLSIGFLLLAYQHWRRIVRQVKSENPSLAKDWEIQFYRTIPLKTASRFWGYINSFDLPVKFRKPYYSWYIRRFNCDISEIACTDLEKYKNLGEFFRRGLREGARPIDPQSPVVSPVDGKILIFGKVENNCIEQVKDVTYSLPAFLGPQTWPIDSKRAPPVGDETYASSLMTDAKNNRLYHCVIYLAPGDYHRFHSPADWEVNYRRYFSGDLFSVNPALAKWISGLFSFNERAVYYGKWKHGFFSMTAVGATNVGSIRVYQDEELETNVRSTKKYISTDKSFNCPLVFKKGDDFGEFNLGSSIVLIFEAPTDFMFSAENRVRFGQSLFVSESRC